MKQPHEDITGSPLTDDLLSLDETAVAHRDALLRMADALLWQTGFRGDLYERMTAPKVGDLVAEVVVVQSSDLARRHRGLGILIERREEWASSDADYADGLEYQRANFGEVIDDERMTVTAWYVQYSPDPGDVCRWTDCQLIALPTDSESKWVGATAVPGEGGPVSGEIVPPLAYTAGGTSLRNGRMESDGLLGLEAAVLSWVDDGPIDFSGDIVRMRLVCNRSAGEMTVDRSSGETITYPVTDVEWTTAVRPIDTGWPVLRDPLRDLDSVLAEIDAAVEDWELSEDAYRWAPREEA